VSANIAPARCLRGALLHESDVFGALSRLAFWAPPSTILPGCARPGHKGLSCARVSDGYMGRNLTELITSNRDDNASSDVRLPA